MNVMWIMSSIAVIAGVAITKEPYVILGLGFPAFIHYMKMLLES